MYIDSITPYRDGERLGKQQFYGDVVTARVFVNDTIPNPTPLPLNLRATYGVTGSFFRKTDTTSNFTIPNDFYTQSLTAELRFGGIEPGAHRAAWAPSFTWRQMRTNRSASTRLGRLARCYRPMSSMTASTVLCPRKIPIQRRLSTRVSAAGWARIWTNSARTRWAGIFSASSRSR